MKTALITGGTRGIGRAIVETLVTNGYRVFATYSRSRTIADELEAQYGQDSLQFFPFDQGNLASHEALLNRLPAGVDILVNNAGLGSKTVENYSDDVNKQDELLMQVNALGPLWLCQALAPQMQQRGFGKIINIASVGGGIFHFPGFRLADGMSKAALTFMTRQMAAEHTHSPVDIYAICPGATETDMFNASTLSQFDEQQKQSFIESLPKQSLIKPQQIADLCLYLCSESATAMHGAIIDSSNGLGVNPAAIA